MKKELKIRDLTLRDGQQSLFATRMKQAQVDRVLPLYHKAGFYAMEIWGGAVPDSVMRYLKESPWDRLESIRDAIAGTSKLTALSRGRNLFGYNPYPEKVIEGFNRNAIESGIDIMRIFDALNDVENMKSTIRIVHENKGQADCAVCYTVDPKYSRKQRIKALLKGKRLPGEIFTLDYFVDKAKQLEALGADMITIKDMAGLIPPVKTGKLIRRLKTELAIPIDFHTHCTPGYGLASTLMAILNGVDIVDTALLSFAEGPAAPSYELVQIFADKLGIETGIDRKKACAINRELVEIRKELAEVDSYKQFPIDFDISNPELPHTIDALFDEAITLAKAENETALLAVTRKIEDYFGFPEPNINVKNAEIPGGMYTNMLAQLKSVNQDHLLNKVLEMVPLVRVDAGCPPLVTPTSQIVGVQAVNFVVDINNHDEPYTNTSVQFVNLVAGKYGKTPIPIDPEFREKITGNAEEQSYSDKEYIEPENPVLAEYNFERLAKNEKEELLLALFPSVAKTFLMDRINERYAEQKKKEEEAYRKAREEYLNMTPEAKTKRLMEGLYNYSWMSR
ncbi:MAG: carboxylase [Bacteroidales bacterium]|nr:carboxylase [Bacteroidales bacterium]MDD3010307.1 carboxylase [Bacteroidales bacterium]MDY0286541.1 carboxylase [Bacteroidales bacterium]HPE87181.1 carboxylase [Bacteroidales bacterium]